ncbi:hypothetical protein SC09_Contig25orf01067 [Bacillus subtilis]|uniref:Uncharacterized protein n=1 Tax=Bacillus subtilis TaxID=1423 RepID=A0A0D1IP87_BACIU|nr:hypothetical protein SC09_Contig25orf01067 [Bacillus subtilis]
MHFDLATLVYNASNLAEDRKRIEPNKKGQLNFKKVTK